MIIIRRCVWHTITLKRKPKIMGVRITRDRPFFRLVYTDGLCNFCFDVTQSQIAKATADQKKRGMWDRERGTRDVQPRSEGPQ